MTRMKHKLLLMAALIMLLSISAVVVAFNLTLNYYIQGQAEEAIREVQDGYNVPPPFMYKEVPDEADELAMQEFFASQPEASAERVEDEEADPSPVYASVIMLNKNYSIPERYEQGYQGSPRERLLIEHARTKLALDGAIHPVQVAGQEYYVAQSQIYDWGDGMEIVIAYVNVTPLKNLVSVVNVIFFGVALLCGVISGVVGFRMGVSIEDAQTKMKHFFENASHELKTPLMAIQGYAEGLSTGVIKDQKRAAQVILDESDKMNALVEEILFISKLESGGMILRTDPFSVNEMLYDNLRAIEAVAMQKQLHLDIHIPTTPMVIHGDEVQISKAVSNILSNALRYAQSVIRVSAAVEGGQVRLTLENDGDQIQEEMLSRLFERFYTGENGHTGIGLSLAKEIVDHHGGAIFAENVSTPAWCGVRFVISLPFGKS